LLLVIFLGSCSKKDESATSDTESPGSSVAGSGDAAPGSVPDITLEAEDAAVVAPMVVRHDDSGARKEIYSASKGSYVELPDGVGKGDSIGGKVVFEFEVKQPARYMLWARVNWLDGCGNSFGVAMDDGPQVVIGEDGTYKVWQWLNIKGDAGIFRLKAGKHKLEFRNTEDGPKLDQVILTTDLDEQAQPQGIR